MNQISHSRVLYLYIIKYVFFGAAFTCLVRSQLSTGCGSVGARIVTGQLLPDAAVVTHGRRPQ